MKRYQVYLDPRKIETLDEAAEITPFTRSKLIQEAVDAASGRIGNLLSVYITPKKRSYSALDKMTNLVKGGKKKTRSSTNADEIYYR